MLQVTVNDKSTYSIDNNEGQWLVNDKNTDLDICPLPNGMISILHNGRSYAAIIEKVDRKNKEVTVRVNGQIYTTTIKEPIDQLLTNMGLDLKAMQKAEPVTAPMPGMVLKVLVEPGQQVNKGDGLIVLEAMKMENQLKAAAPGVVKAIKVAERTAVDKGTILIEME